MKIGSVSWVKRGSYLENARILEKQVDFVELLAYTWDAHLESVFIRELPGLRDLDLFYTVHLPMDTIENCAHAYNFFRGHDLGIRNFILHPLKGWQGFIETKEDVSLENMIQAPAAYRRMTLDVGHLYLSLTGDALLEDPRIREIREVHLHGVYARRDHAKLNNMTLRYVSSLTTRHRLLKEALSDPNLLVNFEIFDYGKLLESLRRFARVYPRD